MEREKILQEEQAHEISGLASVQSFVGCSMDDELCCQHWLELKECMCPWKFLEITSGLFNQPPVGKISSSFFATESHFFAAAGKSVFKNFNSASGSTRLRSSTSVAIGI